MLMVLSVQMRRHTANTNKYKWTGLLAWSDWAVWFMIVWLHWFAECCNKALRQRVNRKLKLKLLGKVWAWIALIEALRTVHERGLTLCLCSVLDTFAQMLREVYWRNCWLRARTLYVSQRQVKGVTSNNCRTTLSRSKRQKFQAR